MAESPKTVVEDYTHFQCIIGVADKEESNYAALQKSDRGVADLSATRAEHAADSNIPEATVDRYGSLQLINEREVEAVSTSHTTQPDRFDGAQQSIADYEISPYDITVAEPVDGEESDFSFIDNISLTNCASASALDNKILISTDTSDKNDVVKTMSNKLDDNDDNVASAVYRSDNGNVAKRVLYNGNANDDYDEINDVDTNVYDEIATAEDGAGVYNEVSTEDTEYAEVDTRPDGVHDGADIYNELQDTYYAATDTFSSSGLLRLSSLSDKQRIIVIIIVVLIIFAVTVACAHVIVRRGRVEWERKTEFISTQRKLKSLRYSNVTARNFLEANYACMGLYFIISSNVFNGRLIAPHKFNVSLLHILTVSDSEAIVEKNLTMPARVNDAVWTTDGHIVCTIASKSVLRLTLDGDIVANHNMTAPTTLYADADGVIYLTDTSTGVYRSTDNGKTWNSLLNTTMDTEWDFEQAIKVFSDSNLNTYDLWTVESSIGIENFDLIFDYYDYRLRVYTVNKYSHTVQSWRNITLPNNISLDSLSVAPHLACDDNNNVFLADYSTDTIHLLSAEEGHYDRLLVNLTYFELAGPGCLSVDKERGIMYVGLCWGQIAWLTLNYED